MRFFFLITYKSCIFVLLSDSVLVPLTRSQQLAAPSKECLLDGVTDTLGTPNTTVGPADMLLSYTVS